MSNGSISQLIVDTANILKAQNSNYAQGNQRNRVASQQSSDNPLNAGSEKSNDNLGKDAFLQLLVTQMKYQDPLSPMDNKDFIAQMAQFSSLEQMQNMNGNMEEFLRTEALSQGAALVGKNVEFIDYETGETLSGVVEKVTFERGKVFAYLDNGLKVDTNDVTSIY